MANDDDAPATKKDLRLLEARIEAKFEVLEAKQDGKFDAMSEQMREMQTELLRAFPPVAASSSAGLWRLSGGY